MKEAEDCIEVCSQHKGTSAAQTAANFHLQRRYNFWFTPSIIITI